MPDRLVDVTIADFDELMSWFPDAASVDTWGGPGFRYPYTRATFIEDCRWPRVAARALKDSDVLLAFGQFYERHERINLARLVVNPARRGEGLCGRLVRALMMESRRYFDRTEYSLFVYRSNRPALRCYEAAGFVIADYPAGDRLADSCFYLTRPLDPRANEPAIITRQDT
jgi:ribosomal protein S18 acetylase RimI-like enzyme